MRIASISKSLTSVLAMKLHEEGAIDLDAPVGSIPELKSLWTASIEADRALQHAIREVEERINESDMRRWGYGDLEVNVAKAVPKWPPDQQPQKVQSDGNSESTLPPVPFRHSTRNWLPLPENPRFPSHWDQVTLRQLLSHTAGVRHYVRDEFESALPYTSTAAALLPFIYDAPVTELDKKNAAKKESPIFFYSTHSYTFASFVIEAMYAAAYPKSKQAPRNVIGVDYPAEVKKLKIPRPFGALMYEKLLAPLGMTATQIEPAYSLVPNRAKHYLRPAWPRPSPTYLPPGTRETDRGLVPAPFVDLAAKAAGGGYLSTAGDIARFGGALIGPHAFLKPSSLSQLWAPLGQVGSKRSIAYGLGWTINKPDPRFKGRIVGHSGAGTGASSYLLVLPDEGIAVAILANQNECSLMSLSYDLAAEFKRFLERENRQ